MSRRDEEALAWAEQHLDGRIVNVERQVRWRPHYVLDVESAGGRRRRVLLRGFRNPGYTTPDEAGARAMLASEAAVLRGLGGAPVAAPEFLGYNAELGWLLMEYIVGEAELTAIQDADRRFRIYTGYVEELARLHAFPLADLDLDPMLPRPASAKEFQQGLLDRHEAYFRDAGLRYPEPVMELGFGWLRAHELPSERPVCLCLTDVGPNQFLFQGNQFRAFIDVEYGMVGDPLMEIGMMRGRDVTYHSGRMTEHIRQYGNAYEQLTGIELDFDALRYWTIAGPTLWNVFALPAAQRPDPTTIDTAFMLSYEVQQKRCILEGLAEWHGIKLEPPLLPEPDPMQLGPLHVALAEQFEHYWPTRLTDPQDVAFARYSKAIADTLARGEASALSIGTDNKDELAELLGHRPEGWNAGLAELQARISKDYEHDLERTLNFLHRSELRREFLYEPMQRATGVSVRRLMQRFDD
jgi:aminoglycoside phosphotransferase (APT) family kinase protein